MNKKILSLFLVVAASAILAVSCNNKATNPTENSNTSVTPTEVKAADVAKALKSIGSYKNGDQTWNFRDKFDSLKTTEALSGTGDNGTKLDDVKKEVKSKIEEALKTKGIKATVTVGGTANASNTDAVTFKVTVAAANEKITLNGDLDDYKDGKTGITISLTPANAKNWK